jgi:hypothetical protein
MKPRLYKRNYNLAQGFIPDLLWNLDFLKYVNP